MLPWREIGSFDSWQQECWHRSIRRVLKNYYGYYTLVVQKKLPRFWKFKVVPSHYQHILSYRNKYTGQRCFILGNGPSLSEMNLAPLKNEITIGANGIVNNVAQLGFEPTFLILEDVKAAYKLHDSAQLKRLKNTIKWVAIHNSYLKFDRNTIFFKTNYPADAAYWFENGSNFSKELHHICYLGGTVTYLALQLAYYLGCKEVYLIGVDHGYGEAFAQKYKHAEGQAIVLDAEGIHILRENNAAAYSHFKIGDRFNIPHWGIQNRSYELARQVFENAGRKVYNAGINSNLLIFPQVAFDDLFVQ
jgi:hypothetical protein